MTRALDVLFAVAQAETPTTVSTLASDLDLPRPTVYRILDTLAARGVVTQGEFEKGYVLTPKLALLASGSRSTATLADATVPFLHRLVALSEETSSVHVRAGDLRVCLAEVEGSRGIRWARGPGWSAPVWAGAVGRVLLAGMESHELEEVIQRAEFHAMAPNTVTSEIELLRLVEQTRTRGWAASESETIDGAAAVAAPMVVSGGRTVGVFSLYASADRLSHMERLVGELRDVANEAGERWSLMSAMTTAGRAAKPRPNGDVSDRTIVKRQMTRATSGSLRRK